MNAHCRRSPKIDPRRLASEWLLRKPQVPQRTGQRFTPAYGQLIRPHVAPAAAANEIARSRQLCCRQPEAAPRLLARWLCRPTSRRPRTYCRNISKVARRTKGITRTGGRNRLAYVRRTRQSRRLPRPEIYNPFVLADEYVEVSIFVSMKARAVSVLSSRYFVSPKSFALSPRHIPGVSVNG
jgi:hypothetical protein